MARRGLAFQLGMAFAVVAAFTALLAAGILTYAWQQLFEGYVRAGVQSSAVSLSSVTADSYTYYGGWQEASLAQIARLAVANDLRLQILDGTGKVLIDSDSLQADAGPLGLSGAIGGQTGTTAKLTPMPQPVVQAPVVVGVTTVGSIKVASLAPGGLLTQRDLEFRAASFDGLAIAAVLALLLASFAGVLYSRRFTKPIDRVTRTAAALRSGERGARTGMTGEDPVGVLGRTLDEMADSIEAEREFERRLTADVAHELRTPLMAIQAQVEAMQDGVLPTDEHQLGIVRDETMRLSRLADSILELSRLERRSVTFHMEPMDLAEPLAQAVDTHRALMESLELTLVDDIATGVKVNGDSDRLAQAFSNLLGNAARYTPEGGSVTVRLMRERGQAVVTVSDTGIGIAADERDRVFTRFWRSDAARERARSGFGIGLAVVREIVDYHGGSVAFTSEVGRGTTFTIKLPLDGGRKKPAAD
jgi:two-component system sensor histidine kinase BaeS